MRWTAPNFRSGTCVTTVCWYSDVAEPETSWGAILISSGLRKTSDWSTLSTWNMGPELAQISFSAIEPPRGTSETPDIPGRFTSIGTPWIGAASRTMYGGCGSDSSLGLLEPV